MTPSRVRKVETTRLLIELDPFVFCATRYRFDGAASPNSSRSLPGPDSTHPHAPGVFVTARR
jgi:hypothetical protein